MINAELTCCTCETKTYSEVDADIVYIGEVIEYCSECQQDTLHEVEYKNKVTE
jgi:hypothetical protein